jgi:SOS-response transcriptional repressor LexA
MKSNMSERIMKLVKRDPSLSLKALCKLVNLRSTSNVFYHIQRLEKAGLVHWTGSRAHINHSERAKQRHKNGLIALRKMTKAEERARIEMVAKKALSDPHGALSEDASLKVLPNGIKVIVRRPALWASRAHQPA